jgi:hypothetical protein
MQHEAGVRKNSRLHYMLPPDVLMLKGEVLRSAISHHEVDSIKNLNRIKRDMYDLYSMKKTPSIQSVKWRPEHSGLMMTGQQLGDDGGPYGHSLKAPPDRYLTNAGKDYYSNMVAAPRSQAQYDRAELQEERKKTMEEHKKALQNEGVEVNFWLKRSLKMITMRQKPPTMQLKT